MWDRVEIPGEVGVHYIGVTPADQPVHLLDGVDRAAGGPIAIGIVLEIGLEDGLQHQLGGGLNDPIPYRRDAKRTFAAARLWGSSPVAPVGAGTSSRPVPRAGPSTRLPRPTFRSPES